ncbi:MULTISPECIES: alpha/beta fold hydrolase [Mumia]|uniref:alpha/beta fold hydrolase n=1 Tax=Mumia TaxID=1546255 RepID=UPI0014210E8C|nr:alpha/beta fold hydrolase [Mumia sp. ZJ1417]QMW65081.1 alpha/beta fold hydrolase [Mumia sp. ZJ1417]
MTTFLLVHGAFRGGWSWRRVRPHLIAAGHDVYAPSLTGAGERVSGAAGVTGLDDWVDELAALVDLEDMDDVVLVGHSQGGVVVRALADRIPHRLRHVVYLDAGVPDPGERAVDLTPPPPGVALPPRETLVPARAPQVSGDLDAVTAAWLAQRLTPTPFAPSLDVLAVAETHKVPVTYAFCASTPSGYPSQTTRDRLDARGVPYDVLDAGHDAPLTVPALVADLLLNAAARPV